MSDLQITFQAHNMLTYNNYYALQPLIYSVINITLYNNIHIAT